jgi:hypothetical protein
VGSFRRPGRRAAIGAAAAPLPEASLWKDALAAIAKGHYIEAVCLYQQIGSKTSEAAARMLAAEDASGDGRRADAQREAQQAIAFGRVKAKRYVDRAEESVRATA